MKNWKCLIFHTFYRNFLSDLFLFQDHIGSLNWGYRVQLRDKKVNYVNAYAEIVDSHTIKVWYSSLEQALWLHHCCWILSLRLSTRPQLVFALLRSGWCILSIFLSSFCFDCSFSFCIHQLSFSLYFPISQFCYFSFNYFCFVHNIFVLTNVECL